VTAAGSTSVSPITCARGEHLLRVAVLLTGDWHAAEDLVQASLVKLRPGGADTLVNLAQFGIGPSDLGQVSPQDLLGLLQSVSQVHQTGTASGHGWTGTAYSFTFTRDFGGPLHLVLRVKGTVGVDRGGRVRQLDADYSIGKTRQRSEMTFGDFGAPVSVSTPPASEVYVPLSG
jgi:hypothetical protein